MKFGFIFIIFSIALFFTSSFISKQNNDEDFNEIIYPYFTPESHLEWRATHLGGIAPRYGKIFLQKGKAIMADNQLKDLFVEIDMNSILVENFKSKNNDNARSLEEHLKNTDFFNTHLYPTSTFQMSKIETGNKDYNSFITGDLTILDRTKRISFYCTIKKTGNGLKIQSQQFDIDRTKWGIFYKKEGSKGISSDAIISNKISFRIRIHLKI